MIRGGAVNITGLVTSVKNKGDSGRLVEIFTQDKGIVYVFAPGARRLFSKYMALTRLFAIVSLECVPNGEFYLLKDGRQLGGFESIERDAIKFAIVADVVKNLRIVSQNSTNKEKISALLMVLAELADKCGDFEVDSKALLTAVDKVYIYVLAYEGMDVTGLARRARYSDALVAMCEYMKGHTVSHVMTDEKVFENSDEAYCTLADIYREQFDMTIDKDIIRI